MEESDLEREVEMLRREVEKLEEDKQKVRITLEAFMISAYDQVKAKDYAIAELLKANQEIERLQKLTGDETFHINQAYGPK